MRSQLIFLLLSLSFFQLKVFDTSYKCSAKDRQAQFCPQDCALSMYGVDAEGQQVGSCCNHCICCANPKIVSVIDNQVDSGSIEEIQAIVVNSDYKLIETCPAQRPQMCPEYYMFGIVGVDAEGNIIESECGNPCFCCSNEKIVQIIIYQNKHQVRAGSLLKA